MFREYKVKDVMETNLLVVTPNDSIKKVAKAMRERNTSEALVAEDKKVKGIVTLRDVVYGIASGSKLQDPVLEIMTTELITASENDNLVDAVKRMRKHNIGRLPIVDENDNLVGILTEKTLIKTFPSIVELLYEESEASAIHQSSQSVGGEFRDGFCESCGNFSEVLRERNGAWICESCIQEE